MKSFGLTLIEVLVTLSIVTIVITQISLYQVYLTPHFHKLTHAQFKLQIWNNYKEKSILAFSFSRQ